MKTRKEHNLEICQKLTEFFSNPNHKDLRFLQGLAAMEIFDYSTDTGFVVDPFNTESSKTDQAITNFLARYDNIKNFI
jgi:hypothetical protein